jgi:hypothetical protein
VVELEQQEPKLNWQNYPQPRLVNRRGVFVVEVSIPVSIMNLFGSGSGTTSNRRKSTGTSDKAAASKMVLSLTNVIYREFDQKQIEHEQRHDKDTDAFAVGVITELAKELNYNNGDMPELAATTGYDRLLKMKDAFDSYTDLIISNGPSKEQILNAFAMISKGMTNMEISTEFLAQLNALPGGPNSGPFTTAQAGLLARHSTDVVQLFWQDLLTSAAMAQGQAAPTFPDKPMMQIAKAGPFEVLPVEVVVGGEPIERPRRVQSVGTLRVSSIRDEYFLAPKKMAGSQSPHPPWATSPASHPAQAPHPCSQSYSTSAKSGSWRLQIRSAASTGFHQSRQTPAPVPPHRRTAQSPAPPLVPVGEIRAAGPAPLTPD